MTLCDVAMEFWDSQRLLACWSRPAVTTPRWALVRLHFEAVVRAIWMHHGATDGWIERFVAPMAPGQLAEPALGPNVDAMLQTISKSAPPFVGQMLGELEVGNLATDEFLCSRRRAAHRAKPRGRDPRSS